MPLLTTRFTGGYASIGTQQRLIELKKRRGCFLDRFEFVCSYDKRRFGPVQQFV
jgi:hypothetical protein